ncbi:TetR family transcriptional regulator [Actinomadura sp. CNU-125]|uniref:TetR/AcrR family transcriptional regulator n=1 Tax=Actinomadura sp. CNU-125 TaxID=1904961 RepID=UPI0009637416|nr:TetR family transcriptional regulator [Actinomadura sp. CNU-125]OLT22727.1 TetR family transcriptional regulator [Actinomadura sp. CNU-125]
MPPANLRRRRALADAAIALLAQEGTHGLTHRAVETLAGVPAGTATNYFRTREALLVAAAERVVELHLADMTAVAPVAPGADGPEGEGEASRRPRAEPTGVDDLVEMLAGSLWTAATALRERYLAAFELQLEARRRPALAAALAGLENAALLSTTELHGELRTPMSEGAIRTLITLYSGTLFTLVALPAGSLREGAVRTLAEAMVRGAFAAA